VASPPDVDDADERYAFLLDQVQRSLTQQQGSLDNLRARAATIVATAALVSSFFGSRVFEDKSLAVAGFVFVVLAIVGLVVSLGAALRILSPHEWQWGFDGYALMRDYIEASPPASLGNMRRGVAWHMQADVNHNVTRLDHLYKCLSLAIGALGAQVLAWGLALVLR
jgi:hypothetical protein